MKGLNYEDPSRLFVIENILAYEYINVCVYANVYFITYPRYKAFLIFIKGIILANHGRTTNSDFW